MDDEGRPRRLVLMRHAKAVAPGGTPDHRRALAPRGERDAAAAGVWLAGAGLRPDLVLSSDSARTRRTTALVLEAADAAEVDVVATPDLYEASVHRVMNAVAGVPEDVRTLLVVGHEPTTSELVAALTGRLVPVPTATLLVVSLPGRWADLTSGAGDLDVVHTPRG